MTTVQLLTALVLHISILSQYTLQDSLVQLNCQHRFIQYTLQVYYYSAFICILLPVIIVAENAVINNSIIVLSVTTGVLLLLVITVSSISITVVVRLKQKRGRK